MIHGIVLGGGTLIALSVTIFSLRAMRAAHPSSPVVRDQSRYLTGMMVFAAAALWLTVLIGTYVSFPAYRASPPDGLTDLGRYPRSLLQSNPQTVWLHALAMEIKEHVPWIAAMLGTAVAYVAMRYKALLLSDRGINRMATVAVTICLALAACAALLGTFVNKVAPLE